MHLVADFVSVIIGVVVALAVVVPNVICCYLWNRVATRRVSRLQLDCDEWRIIATNATIRANQQIVAESDDSGEEFPRR